MKLLKILGIGLVLLIAVYVVLCVVGPKSMNTERSVTVNASAEEVFALVSDYNQWGKWSPWQKNDPNMKPEVVGNPGTIGHKMSWKSDSQGSGEQSISDIVPNQKVTSALKFDGWDGVSYATFNITPEGAGTKVTWDMKGDDVAFMFRGLMLVMGGADMIGKDYENGLASIKEICEK